MRRALPLALALSGLLVFPAGAPAARGFKLGVAAGEVTSDSARIWTRADKAGKVKAEVATDANFTDPGGDTLKAADSHDLTVQTKVGGLDAGQLYYYRFCARGGCSEKGRFTTAPESSAAETIEFAYTGDTDGTRKRGAKKPFFGTFEAFRAMLAEGNDFNVHMGDTIYSDSGVAGKPARSVEAKWKRYRDNLTQANLRKLRAATGFFSHWDDHEFINDFSVPEDGERLYKAGVQAFRDYAPVTYTNKDGLYRSFRWGANLELFFLDERSFRDAKASAIPASGARSGGNVCDNPRTGDPDLAPTAPKDKRDTFSVLVPSLAEPVSEACKNAINDPDRSLLGQRQYGRFVQALDDSSARFKLVMNETPIQQFYGLPYDRWEGYAFERVKLLNELGQRGIANVVFLTTDTHAAFANVIRTRTFANDVAPSNAPPTATDTSYQDFVIGPVATNTFFDEIDDVVGGSGAGVLLGNAFFKPPPPDGVGMRCAQGDVRSYAQVEVTDTQVTIAYKDEDGNTVQDLNGQPCGPYVIAAV